MQKNLVDFHDYDISYSIGDADELMKMQIAPSLEPFNEEVIAFIDDISKRLMSNKIAKAYPDIITLAFWMRRASIEKIKQQYMQKEDCVFRLGRGRAFHIAPSNVPVNYAYSLITGLLCGNSNVVKIPSKEFPQIQIINQAIKAALRSRQKMAPYVILVQYGHEKEINDAFSAIADVRIIWGGDATIKEIRRSEMKPRATEITFADRYSLCVIDSDSYMECRNQDRIANDFYNDTYLTDQNACTSPRAVIWMGKKIEEAKTIFWEELHRIVESKYELQAVQVVNKLTSSYLLAVAEKNVEREKVPDNLIVRMNVKQMSSSLMELKENSGYFFEYNCDNILELKDVCDDLRCQTISYIGDKTMFGPLLKCGVSGIDRIVPIGKTMDFDFMWDGHNLFEKLTRIIVTN